MIRAFKDQSKVNLILTSLFFVGIAVSAYVLYRLPSNLMIPYGYESTFNTVYVIVAATFFVGIAVLSQAMKYKKELVVFRDRTNEMNQADVDAAAENKSTITVEGVKASLASASGEKKIFQQGLDALTRGNAASGQGGSGAEKASLMNYGQGMATNYYNNYLNTLMTLSGANAFNPGAVVGQNQLNLSGQNQGFGAFMQGLSGLNGLFGSSGSGAGNASFGGGGGAGTFFDPTGLFGF